jgi:group I intron endonuclease
MKGIVYKYTSPSGKVYIGQTKREKGRKREFRSNRPYGGTRIDNARAKYGPKNFTYEVLFEVDNTDMEYVEAVLNEKEMYYIQEYKSDDDHYGYNMCAGGAGNVGHITTEERRRKIGENTKRWIKEKGHPLKGKRHKPESIEKMRKNTKKKFGKDNPNYGWKPPRELTERLAQIAREKTGEKNHFFGKHHTEEVKKMLQEKFGRKVIQYHPDTFEKIAEYRSATEAAIMVSGKKKRHVEISKVCNKYVRKDGTQIVTSCGYRWKWKDDPDQTFPIARIPPPPPSFRGHHLSAAQKENISKVNSKSVKQVDPLTGEIIAIHPSATKAAIALNRPKSNSDIGKMCNGKIQRDKVLGFRWEWI